MSEHTNGPDEQFAGLNAEESAAALHAIAEVRERRRRLEEDLAVWRPVLTDLDERPDGDAMAERLIAMSRAGGWDETEDDCLARLAVGIIKHLGLEVRVERHRHSPDRVRVGGYLICE